VLDGPHQFDAGRELARQLARPLRAATREDLRHQARGKRFLADLETSLTRGLYVDPHAGRLEFTPYAQRWLDSRNDEITTRARDASVMRTHVLPQWGTWPLGKIDHTTVQQWVTNLSAQRSPALVAEAHRLLSAVLRAAVRDRLIAFDPCDGVKVPRRRKRDTADQIVDRDTVRRRLLPAVPDRYRALVATAAGTGMRWGELAGLCDDALDTRRHTIRVVRTVVEVSGNTSFKPYPKSAAGRRTIPIPAWLRPTLAEHLDHYPLGANGLIFGNQVGKPLRRTLFRHRVWRPALVRAGLLGHLTHPAPDRFLASWTDTTGKAAQRTVPHRTRRGHPHRHPRRRWAPLPRPPPQLRHLARRRRRPDQHGAEGHGPRTVLHHPRPLHPPHRRPRPHPASPRRTPQRG
jgi:integrase